MGSPIAMLLSAIAVMACGVILWRCDPAINRMGGHTHELIRYAFLLLIAGALVELGLIFFHDHIPDCPEVIILSGAALLLLCERRIRYLTRQPKKDRLQCP